MLNANLRRVLITATLIVSTVSILLESAAGQPQAYIQRQHDGQPVALPNQTEWNPAAPNSFSLLAELFLQSHAMAKSLKRQQEAAAEQIGAERLARLKDAYNRNLRSARLAYTMLRDASQEKSGQETTLYFAPGGNAISRNSPEMTKVKTFVQKIKRERKNRPVIVAVVGSSAPYGLEAASGNLAAARADATANQLNKLLQGVPSTVYRVDGTGGMYGAVGSSRETADTYRHVRATAVYENTAEQQPAATAQRIDAEQRAPLHYPGPKERPALQEPQYGTQPAPQERTTVTTIPLSTPNPAPRMLAPAELPSAAARGRPSRLFANDVGMDFVYIPPGTFMMGTTKDELGRDEDEYMHQVTLTEGFYLSATEVTQEEWIAVMDENPSHFENCGMDCPVEDVSWEDVQSFITKLNAMEDTQTYRLPTEAEWEYACRAGTRTAFYAGGTEGGECGYNEILDDIGWYYRNSERRPHPVARKQPNAWGLYDMHGNVWEWCADREGGYASKPTSDPVGPTTGNARIRRGGSWSHYPMFCRAGNRSWANAHQSAPNMGFRLAKTIKEPEQPKPVPPPKRTPPPAPEPTPPAPGDPCEFRTEENGMMVVRRGIPHAVPEQGAITVERQTPRRIGVGKTFRYKLRLRNNTECDILRVVLVEHPDDKFNVTSTLPQAQALSDGGLRWEVAPFDAGATREFVVAGMATAPGDLNPCATADYRLKVCSEIEAVQPRLTLTKTLPETASQCESIPMTVTVANQGSGAARNVVVTDNLPAGLTTANGQNSVTFNAGTLDTGQSRDFHAQLRAERPGTFTNTAKATGDNGLRAEASDRVAVRAPSLTITKNGRQEQFAGRHVKYTMTVANNGNGTASNVVVRDEIPAGMSYVNASPAGSVSGNTVSWTLSSLGAGEQRTLNLTVKGIEPGAYTNQVTASGDCADTAQASTPTRIKGVSAILLEVADEVDPLEVGTTGTYLIVATNQGSIQTTNVSIVCELEPNLEFVSTSGATQSQVDGHRVRFSPMPSLAPKAKATWRVKVRAVKEGDVRFRTLLNSDQLKRPVEETEATTLY